MLEELRGGMRLEVERVRTCVCIWGGGHGEPHGCDKDCECYSKHDGKLLRAKSREVI